MCQTPSMHLPLTEKTEVNFYYFSPFLIINMLCLLLLVGERNMVLHQGGGVLSTPS